MRADRLIEILSELPADSKVFAIVETIDGFTERYPDLSTELWDKALEKVDHRANKGSFTIYDEITELILDALSELLPEGE